MTTKNLIFFGIILFSLNLMAQEHTENYIKNFNGKNIVFGQLVNNEKHGNWLFFSYDGDSVINGFYSNGFKEGEWIYYENGKRISELSFKDGKKEGVWTGFFKTGEISFTRKYYNNQLNGKTTSYFKSGVIRQERFYKKDNLDSVKTYNENAELLENGLLENGFKIGNWHYLNTLKEDSLITYSLSDSIEFKQYDAEVLYFNDKYIIDEKMPEFPGGRELLIKYLKDNLLKARKMTKKKNKGSVEVQFKINEIGAPDDVVVIKSVSKLIDDEAIRIIEDMPNWTPGLQSGLPVKVSFTFPLRFE